MTKHYLSILALLPIATLACVAIFNYVVDPYAIYHQRPIGQFSEGKIDFIKHLRLTKARQIANNSPEVVILGSSRAGRGLSCAHPVFTANSCYNLALPGIRMYELVQYFKHASEAGDLKQAIVALDYRVFKASAVNASFDRKRLRLAQTSSADYFFSLIKDTGATLISSDALLASLRVIRYRGWTNSHLASDGSWDVVDENFNHSKAFHAFEAETRRRLASYNKNEDPTNDSYALFSELLSVAHAKEIELRILINPSHIRHWQTLLEMGHWSAFEQMKRNVVNINLQIAKAYNTRAFEIRDFSGYNEYSTEPLPDPSQSNTSMNWFWESVHYKKALGHIVIDTLFESGSTSDSSPSFGYPLHPESIEDHLTQQRLKLEGDVNSLQFGSLTTKALGEAAGK